jgi:hypothetical protein
MMTDKDYDNLVQVSLQDIAIQVCDYLELDKKMRWMNQIEQKNIIHSYDIRQYMQNVNDIILNGVDTLPQRMKVIEDKITELDMVLTNSIMRMVKRLELLDKKINSIKNK